MIEIQGNRDALPWTTRILPGRAICRNTCAGIGWMINNTRFIRTDGYFQESTLSIDRGGVMPDRRSPRLCCRMDRRDAGTVPFGFCVTDRTWKDRAIRIIKCTPKRAPFSIDTQANSRRAISMIAKRTSNMIGTTNANSTSVWPLYRRRRSLYGFIALCNSPAYAQSSTSCVGCIAISLQGME